MTSANKNNEVLGPVLALDLGQKRIGVALSDQLLISIRRLDALTRSNWKQLLKDVSELARSYDAKTLVIGLPLRMDGALGSAAIAVREIAEKFSKSMDIPVYLQDERLTSVEARDRLRNEGLTQKQAVLHLDSESAVIILSDFLNSDSKVVASSKLNDE
jgi:putative Holliday junction resolvase